MRIIIFAASALCLAAPSALAQPPCAPLAEIARALAQDHDERPIGAGVVRGGERIAELFASPAGTWTLVIVRTDGLACLALSGTDWTTAYPQIKREGA